MSQSSSATAAKPQPQQTSSDPEHGADEVVRHLSHELRQPLSTIESIAYYLEMVLPPQDRKTRAQVDKLQQLVDQAGWILSDAVHYLQASPPAPRVLDLGEFVSEAVHEFSRSSHLWVRLELATAPTLIRFDPEQLRHQLRNILFCFSQVSKPDPRIGIRTTDSRDRVDLDVTTRAVERSPDEMNAMFNPFSPHSPAGSGLALASVRRIADANQARLDFCCDESGQVRLGISFPRAATGSAPI